MFQKRFSKVFSSGKIKIGQNPSLPLFWTWRCHLAVAEGPGFLVPWFSWLLLQQLLHTLNHPTKKRQKKQHFRLVSCNIESFLSLHVILWIFTKHLTLTTFQIWDKFFSLNFREVCFLSSYLTSVNFDLMFIPVCHHSSLTLFRRDLIWALVPSDPWFFWMTISASLSRARVLIRSLFSLFSPSDSGELKIIDIICTHELVIVRLTHIIHIHVNELFKQELGFLLIIWRCRFQLNTEVNTYNILYYNFFSKHTCIII